MSPRIEMLKEARTEVNAAQQNLREAIAAWETLIANLHPAALLLTAAENRLERANALLRAAIEGHNQVA
jgi:signal transduction histidine kinase